MELDENNLWQMLKEVQEILLRSSFDIKPVSKEVAHKDLQDTLDKMKNDIVRDIIGGDRIMGFDVISNEVIDED